MNLVLNFLATRTLVNETNVPYQFYDATTGQVLAHSSPGNGADEGRLLIALYDLKLLNPQFASRIDAVVARVNYTAIANSTYFKVVGLYPMYSAAGFQLWGFNTHSPNPTSTGPEAGVLVPPEPVMLSILENVANPFLVNAGSDAYSGLYSMHNSTGDLAGFGEGWYPPIGNQSQAYVYEAIEVPGGTNYSAVTAQGQKLVTPPETFTKIAFSLLAVYNSTYSQLLVDHIGTSFETAHGFLDGFISGTNQVVSTTSGNTNNMIMEAAVYAIFAFHN